MKKVAPATLRPDGLPLESPAERYVHLLLITGAWLGEVGSGLSAELPDGSYPGMEPRAVVHEMLCGTIGGALQVAEPNDLQPATDLTDLAGSRGEEHRRLACELSRHPPAPADGDPRTDG